MQLSLTGSVSLNNWKAAIQNSPLAIGQAEDDRISPPITGKQERK